MIPSDRFTHASCNSYQLVNQNQIEREIEIPKYCLLPGASFDLRESSSKAMRFGVAPSKHQTDEHIRVCM